MLQAGTCICPKCGHILKDGQLSIYHNSATGIFLQLGRNPLSGKPDVSIAYIKSPKEETADRHKDCYGFKLNRNVEPNTLPHSIDVSFRRKSRKGRTINQTFERICPLCHENDDAVTPLKKNYGLYPTYVVVITGGRGSGKSCWLAAVSTSTNLAHLKANHYPVQLSVTDLRGDYIIIPVTNLDDIGETQLFWIQDRNGNRIASLLMRDMPGEIFARGSDQATEADAKHWRFIKSSREYPGLDALLFFTPAALPEEGEMRKAQSMAVEAVNRINLEMDQDQVHIGAVLTHLDQVEHCHTAPGKPPMLAPGSFRTDSPGTYSPTSISARGPLIHKLSRSLNSTANHLCNNTPSSQAFLVNSCVRTDSHSNDLDFTKPVHVMDPLIWLLNQFQLLPLNERCSQ